MALYDGMYAGEELVEIAPGVKVPASMAANFAAPQQVAPDYNGGGTGMAIGQQAPGMPITGPEVGQAPSTNPADYGMAPQGPVAAPTEPPPPTGIAAQAAPAQRPGTVTSPSQVDQDLPPQAAPQDPTTAGDLRKIGSGGVYDAQMAAQEKAKQAGAELAKVDEAEFKALEDGYTQQATKQRELAEAQKTEIEKERAAEAKTQASLGSMRDRIANTKIDRTSDYPVLNWIGIALAGLGQALAKKTDGKNPALEAMYAAIDRKVAGQMGDLNLLKDTYGLKRDELADIKANATSRKAMYETLYSAELEKWRIETLKQGARSNSERVKTRATELAAKLGMDGAAYLGQAVTSQRAEDHQKAQLQEQRAGRAESARQHNTSLAFQQKKHADDVALAMMGKTDATNAAQAKALAEQDKQNTETGVGNPTTGEFVLQPEGERKVAQAAKYDEEAAKLEAGLKDVKPELQQAAQMRIQSLRQGAAGLRVEARSKDVWRAGDPKQVTEVITRVAGAQSVLSSIDSINNMAKDNGGLRWFKTTEGEAALQAAGVDLLMQLKEAYKLGVLAGPDMTLLEKVGAGDIGEMTKEKAAAFFTGGALGADPSTMLKKIEVIGTRVKERTITYARTNKYRGTTDDLFRRQTPVDKSASEASANIIGKEKTPFEEAKGHERGKVATYIYDEDAITGNIAKGLGNRTTVDAQKDSLASGHKTYTSLSKGQGDEFDKIWARATDKDPKVAASGREELTRYALDGSRPGLQSGWLQAIEKKDPAVYEALLSKLPEESQVRQTLTTPLPGKSPTFEPGSVGHLAQLAITGQQGALDEISRRAAAGDQDAKNVLPVIIRMRNSVRQ